jgi:hypothetical protein
VRQVTYAIHADGFVISRFRDALAWPVLEYVEIGMGGVERSTGCTYEKGDFRGPTNCHLERFPVHSCHEWNQLRWTKKIPNRLKNLHRQFWGMPLLPEPPHDDPRQGRLAWPRPH